MEQQSTPTTTADSEKSGRLKVSAGCVHGKKKCLKCAIRKYDGKGGVSGNYGATSAQKNSKMVFSSPLSSFTGKKHKSVKIPGGLKRKGQKVPKFKLYKFKLNKGVKIKSFKRSRAKMVSIKKLLNLKK